MSNVPPTILNPVPAHDAPTVAATVAGQMPPPQVPLSSANPTTYHELFADASNDPYQGNYAEIMGTFATTLQPLELGASTLLCDKVFGKSESELQAYLTVTTAGTDSYIQVLHRPSTMRAPLSRAEPDQRFGFLGDSRGIQPPQLVVWPLSAFDQTNSINVIGDNAIDTALAGDENLKMLGPFDDNHAGVTAITTRKLMYLPARYATMAIGRILSPRAAWDEIGGAIRQEPAQVQLDLKPLVNWLKAALIKFDATDVPASNLAPPRPPAILTAGHQDHAAAVLSNDLPPAPTQAQPSAGLTPLVGAVNQLTAEVVQTRNDEAARRANASTRTVQQYYGQATEILLRITHTQTQDQLPDLYRQIANTTKKTLRVTIQEHVRAAARALGLEQYAPVITPDLATRISASNFDHFDINDLQEGIQPFITPAWSADDRADLTASNEAHDTLQDGASASLQDILSLKALTKIAPPLTLLQVVHCLHSYRILLHSVLGESHAVTVGWADFVYLFTRAMPQIELHALKEVYYCMRIVRYLQIRVSTWWNLQVNSPARVTMADLTELLTKIRYQDVSWKPLIPRRYLPPVPAAAVATAPSPSPSPGPSPAPRVTPTVPSPAPASTRNRVNNSDYNAASYQTFRDRNLALLAVRAHARAASDPIPTSDSGTEMCLCYHVLGYCWSNCSRQVDHRPQSPAEITRLKAWCTAHYV